MERKLNVPIKDENLDELKAGDVVYLTGNILTARDQAHKRLLERGAPLNIEGAVLFHAGPIITQEDGKYKMVAIGPTTSMRMNPYQSDVLDMGPKIVIGKGGMDDNAWDALIRNKALYVVATGGCAALYVDAVEEIESVNWLDLGMPEAMWNLKVKDFGPLIVAMDSEGNSLYDWFLKIDGEYLYIILCKVYLINLIMATLRLKNWKWLLWLILMNLQKKS